MSVHNIPSCVPCMYHMDLQEVRACKFIYLQAESHLHNFCRLQNAVIGTIQITNDVNPSILAISNTRN